MSKKLKIISLVGTRPEFIKMSETLKKFDKVFDHIIVNTNQNFEYELNKIFFKDFKLRKPDYSFNDKDISIKKIAYN